jgi:subfamily B ATP-binding cassette protein MsbA
MMARPPTLSPQQSAGGVIAGKLECARMASKKKIFSKLQRERRRSLVRDTRRLDGFARRAGPPNEDVFIFAKYNRELIGWLLRRYLLPYWRPMLVSISIMITLVICTVAVPNLVKPAVDSAEAALNRGAPFNWSLLFILVGIYFARMILGGIQRLITTYIGQKITAGMQVEIFSRFVDADIGFLDTVHKGAMISRTLNDTNQIQGALIGMVLGPLRNVLMVVLLTGTMLQQDWILTVFVAIVLPFSVLILRAVAKKTRPLARELLEVRAEVATALNETYDGLRLVKIYGMRDHEIKRLSRAVRQRRRLAYRMALLGSITGPAQELTKTAATVLAVGYCIWQITIGQMTFGELSAFVIALGYFIGPIRAFVGMSVGAQSTLVAAERVRESVNLAPEIKDPPDARELVVSGGAIRFDDISFAYEPDEPVLEHFDLDIPAGTKVALVGLSGAGKSTILNLIPRLYDVNDGRIMIDGQDIRDVTLASLRGAISVVTQETILFDDTVRANISYAKPKAPLSEIERVARLADAHEFISRLPDGYDTYIGEHGVRLSGGQRQRIAIARALLKDTPILLLDEATSSLDNRSEQAVKTSLDRLMEGRTTLIVAHRLSTVLDADAIHVISDGRIVESGRHDDLIRRDGAYAKLYKLQTVAADPDRQEATRDVTQSRAGTA